MKHYLKTSLNMLVAAGLTAMFSMWSTKLQAQCEAPTLKFHSPVLISGSEGQVGAVYLFQNVNPGVDAHIEVMGLYHGATLYNIDDTTGIGYYDAFQPYVGAPSNDTSYIDWKITFKVAGTNTDTIMPCIAVTGVDVDGNGASLQEFIEAATPGSIAVDPFTILSVSFDGIRSKATSTIFNIPSIDSTHLEAMFQMNFTNISTLLYRNGAISTYGAEMIRQTCIYFKPFFHTSTYTLLPAKLLSFTAKTPGDFTELEWTATNENDTRSYTIQKSIDGKSWKDVQAMNVGANTQSNSYSIIDREKNSGAVLYRIRQLNINGTSTYSKIIRISTMQIQKSVTHNTVVRDAVHFQVQSTGKDVYTVDYFTMGGARLKQDRIAIQAGVNATSTAFPANAIAGSYIIVIRNGKGEQVHSSRLIKR